MDNAEICVLAAFCSSSRFLRNPWLHKGFSLMARAFLKNQMVLMGREAWFDFPYKDDPDITPWILSTNQAFQLRSRAQYPHVRFAEDLSVLRRIVPLKGIWWVLGGFSVYRAVLDRADSIEAVVVPDSTGTVDLMHKYPFVQTHDCPNPFDYTLKCARYERTQVPALHVHQVQMPGIRRSLYG